MPHYRDWYAPHCGYCNDRLSPRPEASHLIPFSSYNSQTGEHIARAMRLCVTCYRRLKFVQWLADERRIGDWGADASHIWMANHRPAPLRVHDHEWDPACQEMPQDMPA